MLSCGCNSMLAQVQRDQFHNESSLDDKDFISRIDKVTNHALLNGSSFCFHGAALTNLLIHNSSVFGRPMESDIRNGIHTLNHSKFYYVEGRNLNPKQLVCVF